MRYPSARGDPEKRRTQICLSQGNDRGVGTGQETRIRRNPLPCWGAGDRDRTCTPNKGNVTVHPAFSLAPLLAASIPRIRAGTRLRVREGGRVTRATHAGSSNSPRRPSGAASKNHSTPTPPTLLCHPPPSRPRPPGPSSNNPPATKRAANPDIRLPGNDAGRRQGGGPPLIRDVRVGSERTGTSRRRGANGWALSSVRFAMVVQKLRWQGWPVLTSL
jgi:hypothetical protein